MAAAEFPRPGTVRREVFDLVAARGAQGATDDEIEEETGRSHQSSSAAMSHLRSDGLLVAKTVNDWIVKRRNRYGNQAIVWVAPTRRTR